MPNYLLQVSSWENPEEDIWLRAGERVRRCIDEFDTQDAAWKEADKQLLIHQPAAMGRCAFRLWDTKNRVPIFRNERETPKNGGPPADPKAEIEIDTVTERVEGNMQVECLPPEPRIAYSCPECWRQFKSDKSVRIHRSLVHKGKKAK